MHELIIPQGKMENGWIFLQTQHQLILTIQHLSCPRNLKKKKRIKMYNFIHKRTSTCITEGKDMVVRNLSTAQNNVCNQHQGGKYHILLS